MPSDPQAKAEALARQVIDDAWEEGRRSPYAQQHLGQTPSRLPDLSLAEASRKSEVGRSLLARAEAIDLNLLPHDLGLSVRLVRFRAKTWAREAEWYWSVIDPMGVGFFGLFLPSAYCGGFLLNTVHSIVRGFRFERPGDLDRYLALATDYARLIEQFRERTAGQAERGMRMPVPQITPARTLIIGLRDQARSVWIVNPERFGDLDTQDFNAKLERRLSDSIVPAFDRLLALLDDDYVAKAPSGVGIGQYPQGASIYESLVRMHTTMDLSPRQVFDTGHARMERIEAEMADVRRELGFAGDGAAFLAHLAADPRWRAETTEGIAAVFQRYIDRFKPRFDKLFRTGPAASYGVEALPQAMQGSMTFGYYDAPSPERKTGRYLFNSANLSRQPLFNLAALNYHELVPGHHLHMASQLENTTLHPFRSHNFVNAYNEGWAEYAATLAGEVGMYEQPEERYGRLVMDAFLTCRLVVDTGMNALGWTLEQARDYMRAHSGMSETEICSETLRYSCDMPAQALAYKLGDTHILALRERMKQSLGDRFDIRDFHAAVLGPGAVPLEDLSWHVEYVMSTS